MIKKTVSYLLAKLFFRGLVIDNADEALRYLRVADLIAEGRHSNPTILEVGSGVKGITPYVPFKVTGVDISFNGEIAENLTPVCVTGTSLPFAERSYDFVISVDMLEHVPRADRPTVIQELMRVAGKRIILAVPCGKLSEAHDKELDDYYQIVKGERYSFLQEHVDNGLPDTAELESCIKAAAETLGVQIRVRIVGNVSLRVRKFFMRTWIGSRSPKLFVWISPLLCIFRRFLNFGHCYRQIFIVDIMPVA